MNPLFRLSVVKAGAGDFLFQQVRLKGNRTVGQIKNRREVDRTKLTARLGFNDRMIQLQRALQFLSVFTGGIAGYLLELMIEMGETVVAAVICHLADIDVFVDQQFGCV